MRLILAVSLCVFVGLFAVSGLFALLGAVLGFTFGVVGAVFDVVWSIVFSPLAIVALIAWLVFRPRFSPR